MSLRNFFSTSTSSLPITSPLTVPVAPSYATSTYTDNFSVEDYNNITEQIRTVEDRYNSRGILDMNYDMTRYVRPPSNIFQGEDFKEGTESCYEEDTIQKELIQDLLAKIEELTERVNELERTQATLVENFNHGTP